jgi:hypothetical protein
VKVGAFAVQVYLIGIPLFPEGMVADPVFQEGMVADPAFQE